MTSPRVFSPLHYNVTSFTAYRLGPTLTLVYCYHQRMLRGNVFGRISLRLSVCLFVSNALTYENIHLKVYFWYAGKSSG